jgi:uncharacterized membrane protein YeaQ/YmgE (transglycosylase-associated protein family)
MLSEEHQKIAAREILAIPGVLLLAIALKMLCFGAIEYPFRWVVTGLYFTRWVWWALTKADRSMFRQNGLILAFVGGVALVVGSLLNIAALVTMLQRESQPSLAATALVPAVVGAAVGVLGVLLVRWALRRQKRGMKPGS